jgi:hypothetical protein
MKWKEMGKRHILEAYKDDRLIIRFGGVPTFIPKSIPYSKPRPGWLIKGNNHYALTMKISKLKSKLALTSIEIPSDSPMADVAKSLKPVMKYSVFYQEATIEMSVPNEVSIMTSNCTF